MIFYLSPENAARGANPSSLLIEIAAMLRSRHHSPIRNLRPMLRDGIMKRQCPFRAVPAAVSSTHIIAHLQFLPFLSERSSVGCFEEVGRISNDKPT